MLISDCVSDYTQVACMLPLWGWNAGNLMFGVTTLASLNRSPRLVYRCKYFCKMSGKRTWQKSCTFPFSESVLLYGKCRKIHLSRAALDHLHGECDVEVSSSAKELRDKGIDTYFVVANHPRRVSEILIGCHKKAWDVTCILIGCYGEACVCTVSGVPQLARCWQV